MGLPVGRPEVISLYLSRPLADRALRIMHVLLTEAEIRGYTVETQTDLQRGDAVHALAIVIRCRAFPLVLTERTAMVPREPAPQELRRQEHSPWTRVPKYDEEFIGRLALGAPAGNWYQHSYFYSDGARWTLELRLGHLLQISNASQRKPNAGCGRRNCVRPSSGAAGMRPSPWLASSRSSSTGREF